MSMNQVHDRIALLEDHLSRFAGLVCHQYHQGCEPENEIRHKPATPIVVLVAIPDDHRLTRSIEGRKMR